MKLICAMCESRPVHVVSARRYGSSRGVGTHDLCDQCYRSLRNQVVAARMGPKPNWAIRATLKVMNEQRTRNTRNVVDGSASRRYGLTREWR